MLVNDNEGLSKKLKIGTAFGIYIAVFILGQDLKKCSDVIQK